MDSVNIEKLVKDIESDLKYGSCLYEDEKFMEIIGKIELLKYNIAQEFMKNYNGGPIN